MGTLASTLVADRYRMVRSLGHGAMAEVWEANDEALQRRVAIKILHPHLRTPSTIARFRAEGLATARLGHPAIVTVFDTISLPDLEAIVMELVDGRTLRFVLDQRGTLTIERAVHIATTVADALHMAHLSGVVHRDVKPANIILGRDGTIKITDFGIAKSDVAIDLTETGTYVGTARYVAPEQVRGERANARSDVYALGTVLYESLAGHSPFSADHDDALALARLHRDAPSVRSARPDVSPALDAVVARALARDPRDRYESAAAFADALRRVSALRAPHTSPPHTPSSPDVTTVAHAIDTTTVARTTDARTAIGTVTAPPAPPTAKMAVPVHTASSVRRAATTDTPEEPVGRHDLRWIFKVVVLTAIIAGAALLALALLAGSDTVAQFFR
jgi:serine/threonine-protein kinase